MKTKKSLTDQFKDYEQGRSRRKKEKYTRITYLVLSFIPGMALFYALLRLLEIWTNGS